MKRKPQEQSLPAGIHAIAFDVFGTLCEADPMGDLLRWHRDLPAADRRRIRDDWMCGRIGFADLVKYGRASAAPPTDVLEHQAHACAATTRLSAHATVVLNELKNRGYPMACVSNLAPTFGPYVRRVLSPWIEHCVFSYEVGARKPGPVMFDTVCKALRSPPGRILMVGDSPRSDVEGASNFGMSSLLVSLRKNADGYPLNRLVELLPKLRAS